VRRSSSWSGASSGVFRISRAYSSGCPFSVVQLVEAGGTLHQGLCTEVERVRVTSLLGRFQLESPR
jgi:hypothetical protein